MLQIFKRGTTIDVADAKVTRQARKQDVMLSSAQKFHYMCTQGECRVSCFEGWRGQMRIYARVELEKVGMKLEIASETLDYFEGAYDMVIDQLYDKVLKAKELYSH